MTGTMRVMIWLDEEMISATNSIRLLFFAIVVFICLM
jgi:hypothetical protein